MADHQSNSKPAFKIRLRSFNHVEEGKENADEENADEENADEEMVEAVSRKRHWRTNLKEHPEKYKEYLAHEAVSAKIRRLQKCIKINIPGNEEEKRVELDKRAKKMRKFRLAKKEEKSKVVKSTKPKTRAEVTNIEKQRTFWATEKKTQREKMTAQQKEEVNRKRREKRKNAREELVEFRRRELEIRKEEKELKEAKERDAVCQRQLQQEEDRLAAEKAKLDEETRLGNRSSAAKRKCLARARSSISKDPTIYAETVSELVQKASPKKKTLLEKEGITSQSHSSVIVDNVVGELSQRRKSRKKDDVKFRRVMASALLVSKKYKSQRRICKTFNITPKLLKVRTPRAHKRRVSESTKKTVHKFYEKNAITLPDKKLVSKKTHKPAGFLTLQVKSLHTKFGKEHPDIPVGLSTFSALRPSHIKLRGSIKYRGCLCEYCANLELKMDVLNKCAHTHNMPSPFSDIYSFIQTTMCKATDGDKHSNLACIQRKCGDCGVAGISSKLNELSTKQMTPIVWRKWANVSKVNNGKKTSKMVLQSKEGEIASLIQELEDEAGTMAEHLFTASWQNSIFSDLSNKPPKGWVVMVLDFAENYSCRYQDEVQSVHWGHDAATIHPIVAYYQCPNCDETTTDSLIMISNDITHDHHAVHSFTTTAVNHLKRKLGPQYIKKIVRYSDGCATQYKSRGPFMDTSYGESDYGVEFHHEFFGSRHGKGPSDGESGVVKRKATDAVMAGTAVIATALDMFNFVEANATCPPTEQETEPGVCHHFYRSVFWVDSINRDRNREARKTVVGTRRYHSVRSVKPKMIAARHLSCFCDVCRGETTGACRNGKYVKPLVYINMENGITSSSVVDTTQDQRPKTNQNPNTKTADPKTKTADPHTKKADPHTKTADPHTVDTTVDTTQSLETIQDQAKVSEQTASNLAGRPSIPIGQTSLKTNGWVAVIYDDVWWPGVIQSVKDHSCVINFMMPVGVNKFVWPTKVDCSEVKMAGILTSISEPPFPTTSRYYSFHHNIASSISAKMDKYFKNV